MHLVEQNLVFPCLLPGDKDFSVFDGFCSIQGKDHRIQVRLGPENTTKSAQFFCSPELYQLISPHASLIQQRLQQCQDINKFFIELRYLLDTQIPPTSQTQVPKPQYYLRLMEEVESLGWQNIVNINDDLSSIQLSLTDSSGYVNRFSRSIFFWPS